MEINYICIFVRMEDVSFTHEFHFQHHKARHHHHLTPFASSLTTTTTSFLPSS